MKNRIAALLLALILAFALTGCGLSGLGGKGSYVSYITKNNLTFKSYEPEELAKGKNEKDHFYSLQLSGLLDENTAETIEAAITDEVGDFKDAEMPSYDGLKKAVSGKPTGVTVTTKAKGSFNNILSVLLTKNVYYKDLTWSDTRTLNFDLRNGELITFEDLFCNESKPGTLLAEKCMAYLEENKLLKKNDEPKYTKNQKYYLDLDGVHVIYDYATGGVNLTEFKPVEVVVPFNAVSESIDIEKYLTNESLFEDSAVHCLLLPSGADLEESENNIPDRTNLAMIQYLSWPVDIPNVVLNQFIKVAEVNEDEIDKIYKTVNDGIGVYHYKDMANCQQIGNYYNIVRSKSLFGSGVFTENKTCIVYDTDGNKVKLSDIFVKGTDYISVIKKALKESLSNYYEEDSYGGKTLDEIYGGLNFYIDSEGIGMWTEGISLKNENGNKHESSVSFFIEYEEFGCENLTIFS